MNAAVGKKLDQLREKLKEDKKKEDELARELERRRKTQSAMMLNDLHIAVQTLIDRNHIPMHRENSYPANRLNHCVERVLVFGLKKSWLGFKPSFFEFICAGALESEHPRLRHDSNLAKSIQDLNNDAKGRAFLRQALNEKHLAEYISILTTDPNFLKLWYNPWSLIGNPRQLETFKATLEDLDLVKSDFNLLLNDKKLNILQLWEFDKDDVPQWLEDAERGSRKATLAASNPDEEVVSSLPKKKKKKKKRKREKLDIVASDDPSLYESKAEAPPAVDQVKSVEDLLKDTDIESLKKVPKAKQIVVSSTKDQTQEQVSKIEETSEPVLGDPPQPLVQTQENVAIRESTEVDSIEAAEDIADAESDSASDKAYSEEKEVISKNNENKPFAMGDLFANDEIEKTSYLAPMMNASKAKEVPLEKAEDPEVTEAKTSVSVEANTAAVAESSSEEIDATTDVNEIKKLEESAIEETPTKEVLIEPKRMVYPEEIVEATAESHHEEIVPDLDLHKSLSEEYPADGRSRYDTESLENLDWNTYQDSESEEEIDTAPEPVVETVFPGSAVKHRPQSQSFSTVIEWTLEPLPKRNNVKIMKAQNEICATCGDKLKHNFLRRRLFHYCRYTGKFHCLKCHKKDMHVIPSRVIHKADTRKTKVCRSAYFYLKQMYSMHCISLSSFTRETLESRPVLKEFVMTVKKLVKVNHFIQTCRYRSKLLQLIGKYRYLLSNHELISLEDVVEAIDGTLVKDLKEVLVHLEEHVRHHCELCRVRGHICEICQDDRIIFSFDFENVVQCSLCGGVFHRHCFKPMLCPRCARRSRRSISQANKMFMTH